MKKRLLAILLCLCMAMALFPTVVLAVEVYGVSVKGEHFTSASLTMACGGGTATLDTSTTPYTLTLTNATIEVSDSEVGLNSTVPLKIVLIGSSSISCDYPYPEYSTNIAKDSVVLRGDTTIEVGEAGASLTLSTAGEAKSGIFVYSGQLTIKSGTVTAKNTNSADGQGIYTYPDNPRVIVTGGDLICSGCHAVRMNNITAEGATVLAGSDPTGVGATQWDGSTAMSDYKYVSVSFTAPPPLAFTDNASYDVPAGTVSTAIMAVDVSGGVSGGTTPYLYSLENAPTWLTINSSTGVITGTRPTTAAAATTATVKVTDSASPAESKTITIAVGATTAAPTYNISATPETISFESKTAGYSAAPAAQTVTIENTGNQSVTVSLPTSTNYTIAAVMGFTGSTATLAATGDTATFTVQPKTGLAAGNYNETVTVSGNNGASDGIAVSFTVLSGGGGGGSYTPPTYVVPVSGSENSINASATVFGGTATVTVNADRLNTLLNDKDTTGNIEINAGLNRSIDTVTIRTTVIKSISDAAQDEDKAIIGLDIVTDSGTVSFDKTALAALAQQANDSTVTIHVEEIAQSGLTTTQRVAMTGDHENDAVIEVTARSGGVIIKDYNMGKITVTVPYTLKEGENAEGICVWHLASDGTLTLMECSYDAATKTVSFITDHLSDFIVGFDAVKTNPDTGAWDNPFTDVSESNWFYEDIALCYILDLMKGTSDTTFSPYVNITRGMIVTILYRQEGEPEIMAANPFTDVASDKYYTNAIIWAEKNEIVYGYGGGLFGPEDAITREQMAAILYRYAQFKGYDMTITGNLNKFTDKDVVSSYAVDAMKWAIGSGLIEGKPGNILDPQGEATRAEFAAMLRRFIEKYKLVDGA